MGNSSLSRSLASAVAHLADKGLAEGDELSALWAREENVPLSQARKRRHQPKAVTARLRHIAIGDRAQLKRPHLCCRTSGGDRVGEEGGRGAEMVTSGRCMHHVCRRCSGPHLLERVEGEVARHNLIDGRALG